MTNPLVAGLEAVKTVGKVVDDVHYSREEAEQNITNRHLADAQSDNWLAKSIRPAMAVIFTGLWIYFHVLASHNPDFNVDVLNKVNDITMLIVFFYFGSRGVEKVFKRRNMTNLKIEEKKANVEIKRAEEAVKIERLKERQQLRIDKRERRREERQNRRNNDN